MSTECVRACAVRCVCAWMDVFGAVLAQYYVHTQCLKKGFYVVTDFIYVSPLSPTLIRGKLGEKFKICKCHVTYHAFTTNSRKYKPISTAV